MLLTLPGGLCLPGDLSKQHAWSLQVSMGSNLLESGDTFSQLAHDTSSLAAFNTVPGNSYMMITPLLARDDKAGRNKIGMSLFVSKTLLLQCYSRCKHVCRTSVSLQCAAANTRK